jgi:hypothetical protein
MFVSTEACDAELVVAALAGDATTTPVRDSVPPMTAATATLLTSDFRV